MSSDFRRYLRRQTGTNGYWHIKLDHTSSLLTTFQTESGRYRWLRLLFGIKRDIPKKTTQGIIRTHGCNLYRR